MKLAILLIILSLFSTIFDGGELCFSHDGDIHLNCCCKTEATIKKPCCGSKCVDISFPSVDVAASQTREDDHIHFEVDPTVLAYHQTICTLPTFSKNIVSDNNYRFSGDRSHISLVLSKTIFRC